MVSTTEDAVLRALRRITRAIDVNSRRLASRFGLTTPQLVSLRAITEAGEITPSSLARAVDLSQATVTGITDRLARRGLIVRSRDQDDRRRVTLRLTDRGRALLADAPSALQESFAERLGQLPASEQQLIQQVLERIVRMMDAEGLDAARLLAPGPPTADAGAVEAFLEGEESPPKPSERS